MSRLAPHSAACMILAVACLVLGSAKSATADQAYVVQVGDTLAGIAEKFYGNQSKWPMLFDANRSQVEKEGHLIYVGSQLLIPGVAGGAAGAIDSVYASAYGKLDETSGLMTIDIATGPDFTPWTDDELPNGGMVTEIVEKAFNAMGYKPAFEFINWPSGYRLTEKGKFAATFPYAPTEERMQSFLYSDSVYDTLTMVFTRSDSGFEYTQPSDLRGKRGCRPAGYFTEFIDGLIEAKQLELQQPKTLEDCYEALLKNEADVVFIAELEGNAKIRQMGIEDQVRASEKAINISGLHVIFPKSIGQSEELLTDFNDAVRTMAAAGDLDEIVSRHLEAYYNSYGN